MLPILLLLLVLLPSLPLLLHGSGVSAIQAKGMDECSNAILDSSLILTVGHLRYPFVCTCEILTNQRDTLKIHHPTAHLQVIELCPDSLSVPHV